MQEAADDLVKLYKRISLDDDLDDTLRGQLLSQLTAATTVTAGTLRLVTGTAETAGAAAGHPLGHPLGHSITGEKLSAAEAGGQQQAGQITNSSNSQHQQLSANPYFQVHDPLPTNHLSVLVRSFNKLP